MRYTDWKDAHYITPNESNNDWRKSKLLEINHNLQHTNNGFIAEFGTWKNFTLNHIARSTNKTIHGFDSLEGLPYDMQINETTTLGKKFSFNDAEPLEPNVSFHKGWFKDTIPNFLNHNKEVAGFINIDGDVYDSAMDVLVGLNDRIISGTIIRFDELVCWRTMYVDRTKYQYLNGKELPYYTKWEEGEWKALNDWCNSHARVVEPLSRTWFLSASVRVVK